MPLFSFKSQESKIQRWEKLHPKQSKVLLAKEKEYIQRRLQTQDIANGQWILNGQPQRNLTADELFTLNSLTTKN